MQVFLTPIVELIFVLLSWDVLLLPHPHLTPIPTSR